MLLSSSLLRQTSHLNLLSFAQLADQGTLVLRVSGNRITNLLVDPLADDNQIPRVDRHDAATAARVQRQSHAAAHTVVFTVAVSCVVEVLVAVVRVQGDHAEAVGEELIREDRGIAFDFDDVECQSGHFGEDNSSEGVGE